MHFVIIGNGVAGIEAAFTIRERYGARRARITVISDESDFFISRTALMYAYMERLARRDLEPFERDVYDRQKIERVRGRVVDLDAVEQVITLESGSTVAYDKLLLAVGARPRMVPFKGLDAVKEGIVHLVSLQDLDECERLTWSTDQAVVVGGGLIGVELAESLCFHKVDVTFLVREPYYWPMALGAEEGTMVTEHIRTHGVDLRHEEQLDEILVDSAGRVRGLLTDKGNEIPCQMLAVAIGVQANVGWLEGVKTPPQVKRGILVDRGFETSLEHVFAAGDCVEMDMGTDQNLIETIWYAAKLHGRLAARSMMGDNVEYAPGTFYNSSKFFDVEFTTVGEIGLGASGIRSLYRRMEGKPISQRIVYDDNEHVLGFNMLGSRWDHTLLMRWVEERQNLEYVRENLHRAQFDVEFGRIKLHKMHEKEVVS